MNTTEDGLAVWRVDLDNGGSWQSGQNTSLIYKLDGLDSLPAVPGHGEPF
jgi:hypothetical protein